MKLTDKEKAVLKKVLDSKVADVDLFKGVFDATNGNKSFMNGIVTVFESLYYEIGQEESMDFLDMFLDNMERSIDKAMIEKKSEVLL